MTRYGRQELIEDWKQENLQNTRVLIASDGLLGHLTLFGMAAMGFGDVEYYCTVSDTVFKEQSSARSSRQSRAENRARRLESLSQNRLQKIAETSRRMNADVEILGLQLDASRNKALLAEYDIVIDTTNDPRSKLSLAEYCMEKGVPFISASSTEEVGGICVVYGANGTGNGINNGSNRSNRGSNTGNGESNASNRTSNRANIGSSISPSSNNAHNENNEKLLHNALFLECSNKRHGIDTAGVMAGLAVEEARKFVAPLKEELLLDDIVLYYPYERPYFERHETSQISGVAGRNLSRMSKTKVAIVGAGALGNFTGLNLVLSNAARIDIYDFDEIEETNLNRQIFFYERIGQNKAQVLKERLEQIESGTSIRAYSTKVGLKDADKFGQYDIIVDCVDSFATRAMLNYISRYAKVPLISGGSSYQAGQVMTCKDACLNCQFDINNKAKRRAETERQSCIYAPTPSVITSNMIIGFLEGAQCKNIQNAGEARERTAEPMLKYVSSEKYRLGEIKSAEPCNCTAKGLLKEIEGLYG